MEYETDEKLLNIIKKQAKINLEIKEREVNNMTVINNVKKICSFYTSEWHLIAMLLPNLNEKINKGIKITTISEKNLQNKIEELMNKINIENKNKILKIGWNYIDIYNKEIMEEKIKNNDCIFIIGKRKFIKNVNKLINEFNLGEKILTIIDCYQLDEIKNVLPEILQDYNTIINTSGEKLKEEYVSKI